jgi:hypothetical protein
VSDKTKTKEQLQDELRAARKALEQREQQERLEKNQSLVGCSYRRLPSEVESSEYEYQLVWGYDAQTEAMQVFEFGRSNYGYECQPAVGRHGLGGDFKEIPWSEFKQAWLEHLERQRLVLDDIEERRPPL